MHEGMNSESLFQRALKVAPGGVHSPVRSFKGLDRAPVFFKSAQGAYLTSVEDKKYIDFCQSFGPLILGHLDPEVKEAVHKMVDTAWTFGATEIYSLELAEWITSTLPFMEKLRFVSSGTEAVMSVLRVARAATGRDKILKFEGCYHGHVDNLLVKAGSGLAGAAASSSAGISAQVASQTLVTPLDDEAALEAVFQAHASEIAAVIIEPLPANYGLLVQRPEFLKKVADLCKKHGSLLIYDEVISGFRVGLDGMVGKTGIRPDLVTYGKIIGGGFPVGCYGGRADLMNLVAPSGDVYQAGTLSANPVGMRAGLVTLQKMQRVNGWNVLSERTQKFVKSLQAGFDKKGLPLQVSSEASLFWIHGKSDKTIRTIEQIPANQGVNFKKLFLTSLDKGVYLAPNAYEVGFVSWAHTDEILAEAAEKIISSAE
ncbi:glutamate-1-semialdehyde 2,1-aminomutase [Bdellovibrio sp. HCB2-146]|uniref:glutamate-1-semialdehyde 2,1-aminomutase n=1 Tax=Bdellovibrio sp. HCB2-146 TaxID=3394362 RepID=UPI0039BC6BB1